MRFSVYTVCPSVLSFAPPPPPPPRGMKPFWYSLLRSVYLPSQLPNSVVVHPLLRNILDPFLFPTLVVLQGRTESMLKKIAFIYQSFDVIKISSRFTFPSLNTSCNAPPISASFKYSAARSRCLYPYCRASLTACPTSPFEHFHVL